MQYPPPHTHTFGLVVVYGFIHFHCFAILACGGPILANMLVPEGTTSFRSLPHLLKTRVRTYVMVLL